MNLFHVCAAPGCKVSTPRAGLCATHRSRMRRHGTVDKTVVNPKSDGVDLTPADVALIRRSLDSGLTLAKRFDVSQATIKRIRRREGRWAA